MTRRGGWARALGPGSALGPGLGPAPALGLALAPALGLAPALALALGLALAGCGGDPPDSRDASAPILVLAASDLLHAFEELIPLWEQRSGRKVDLSLGSTGNLAAQIRHGAPADLYFAADERFIDELIEHGHIDAGSRTPYAVGRLALAVPTGTPLPTHPSELADPRFRLIAIANPEHAPYGRAARETLERAGIHAAVSDRLVPGENIAHALQLLRTGNADAGLVAVSLLEGTDVAGLDFRLVDHALHDPLLQVAGVVARSPRADAARDLLEFVTSNEGQAILARYGFEPPPGPTH